MKLVTVIGLFFLTLSELGAQNRNDFDLKGVKMAATLQDFLPGKSPNSVVADKVNRFVAVSFLRTTLADQAADVTYYFFPAVDSAWDELMAGQGAGVSLDNKQRTSAARLVTLQRVSAKLAPPDFVALVKAMAAKWGHPEIGRYSDRGASFPLFADSTFDWLGPQHVKVTPIWRFPNGTAATLSRGGEFIAESERGANLWKKIESQPVKAASKDL